MYDCLIQATLKYRLAIFVSLLLLRPLNEKAFIKFFVPLIRFRPLDGATTFLKSFGRQRALLSHFKIFVYVSDVGHLLNI